jgi:hypothetical protein
MDLRLVEDGNRTMKIVGKKSVVAAVLAGRSKRAMCFAFAYGNIRKCWRVIIPRFVGSLESADNPSNDTFLS